MQTRQFAQRMARFVYKIFWVDLRKWLEIKVRNIASCEESTIKLQPSNFKKAPSTKLQQKRLVTLIL